MLVGYARTSTLDQNLSLQFDALIKAGVDEENIYSDQLSGTKDNRPGLNQALDNLQSGDTLVVWKLDRLGRSVSQVIKLTESLGKRGVELKSTQDSIDTNSAYGRFFFVTMVAMAQLESDLTKERVNAGLEAAKRRGVKLGRKRQITQEQIELAVELKQNHPEQPVTDLCKGLGIDRKAYYRYIYPELGI